MVVVKAENNEPALDSLGWATFTQRPLTMVTAFECYLKPFLVGHPASDIEDRRRQSAYLSSYWRSGPVLETRSRAWIRRCGT